MLVFTPCLQNHQHGCQAVNAIQDDHIPLSACPCSGQVQHGQHFLWVKPIHGSNSTKSPYTFSSGQHPVTHNMMLNLSEHLQTAVRAAHAAAEILQTHAHGRDKLVIDKKARNDLVSAADREAEDAILDILKTDTPAFGIVAEETGGMPSGAASWFIDPLDGTTNFLHGIPHYAVSIALVAAAGTSDEVGHPLAAETPVVAVVYDPCKEEMFTAMHGVGAWLNVVHLLDPVPAGRGLRDAFPAACDAYLSPMPGLTAPTGALARFASAVAGAATSHLDSTYLASRTVLAAVREAMHVATGVTMPTRARAVAS